MHEAQIIALVIWAGIAGIQERFLGVTHIDRPIVAGLVVGLVTGHMGPAVMAGASLELVFIGAQAIGGSVPPDVAIGGIIGAVAAVTTGHGTGAAVATGVPAALLGSAFMVFTKSICTVFGHAAERSALRNPPSLRGIALALHAGNALYFLRAALPIYFFLQFGQDATKHLFNAIPAGLLTGLNVMGVILPAVGFAIVLNMLLTARLAAFGLIGFFCAAYLKVPAFGVAVMGIALAALYFYYGQDDSKEAGASGSHRTGDARAVAGPARSRPRAVAGVSGAARDSSPVMTAGSVATTPGGNGSEDGVTATTPGGNGSEDGVTATTPGGNGSGDGVTPDPGGSGDVPRTLTKRELRQLFWRNFGLQGAFSFERMQTHGFVWVIMPLLRRLYPEPTALREALRRHFTFFNTDPYLGGNVIIGVTAAMEAKAACEADTFDAESINGLKVGLMGPFAGIGDSLINGTIRIILTGVAIGLATSGSIVGPIFFLVTFNAVNFLIRWNGLHRGYMFGTRVISMLNGALLRKWMDSGAVLGLCVMAGLIPSYITVGTPVAYHTGKLVEKLQTDLDSVLPALIPLLIVIGCMWMLRKRISPVWAMVALVVIGIGLGWANVLGVTG